jgi:hypothetical protein
MIPCALAMDLSSGPTVVARKGRPNLVQPKSTRSKRLRGQARALRGATAASRAQRRAGDSHVIHLDEGESCRGVIVGAAAGA